MCPRKEIIEISSNCVEGSLMMLITCVTKKSFISRSLSMIKKNLHVGYTTPTEREGKETWFRWFHISHQQKSHSFNISMIFRGPANNNILWGCKAINIHSIHGHHIKAKHFMDFWCLQYDFTERKTTKEQGKWGTLSHIN